MACFILIPGAMHGAWTWDRIVPLLERAGHRAVAPELPGMGTDRSVALGDITLDLWVDFLAGVIGAVGEPVILAGHSRGGLVIGAVAERLGGQVQGLVYVTALIVPPGKTVADLMGANPDKYRDEGGAERPSGQLGPDVAKALFYNRCTPEDADWAVSRLCPEPMQLLTTPAGTSWEGWGRVPRAYIECTDDAVLDMDRQRLMQAAAPCDPVIRLDTDHSPFLSDPEGLVAAMIGIAERFAARS